MKKTFLIAILLVAVNTSFCQQIDMKIGFWGYKFENNGEKLDLQELYELTESQPEAHQLLKKGLKQRTYVNILSIVSGGLLAIPINQALYNKEENWTLAYIGAGIIVASIPLSLSAFNKINKGIDDYNISLKSAHSSNIKPKFFIITNNNGVGLSMNF